MTSNKYPEPQVDSRAGALQTLRLAAVVTILVLFAYIEDYWRTYMLCGLTVMAASYVIPFRSQKVDVDLFWDLAGFVSFMTIVTAYSLGIEGPGLGALFSVPWISKIHESAK